MNKRIQELAHEAGLPTYNPEGIPTKLEKFAELIVKECAKFLEDNSGYSECNYAWHPEPEELLEHFGVEL